MEVDMSWNPSLDPVCPAAVAVEAIETLIVPRARDIGGFEVRRALPAPKRQMVGPFIFFDQAGPAQFVSGQGVDVRPHPHIGLATVTYLFRGEFQHHDSLGSNQIIVPGAVNWMVAGRGVTHSERTSDVTRKGAAQPVRHPDLGRPLGKKPRLVPMPFGLWHALASVAEMLPEPPITRNQVELMQLDNVASPGAPGFGDLRISSTSLEDALPAIVGPSGGLSRVPPVP
jgi:Pirin